MPRSNVAVGEQSLSDIPVDDLRHEYLRRGLDDWSDSRLIAAVAAVVATPRKDPSNSFVLHAPLELSARAALLPLVRPGERELARLHIVAIAAQYQAFGPPIHVPDTPALPENVDAARWLLDAVASGDEPESVRAARVLSTSGADAVIDALTDPIAASTAAAGHAPIFLHLLRRGGRSGPSPSLLVPLARELAVHPDWRIRWLDERERASPTRPEALAEALASTPIVGPPANTFIHPLMMQVDEGGIAASQLSGVLGEYDVDAAREVTRTAARSMLHETCEHAPYGWTHCLTIPQALLGLVPRSADPARLLGLAATQVVAFRTALGSPGLPTTSPTDLPRVDADELATLAATSHDAHIVKYVLACLDAASSDPDAAGLHLAAGRRLLDCWHERGGDPTDPLA